MQFPITHEKLLAYATECTKAIQKEIQDDFEKYLTLDPGYILSELKCQIHESVRLKTGQTMFRVSIGEIRPLTPKYNRETVLDVLHTECLDPLIALYFPCATIRINGDSVYVLFDLREISTQTNSPSPSVSARDDE